MGEVIDIDLATGVAKTAGRVAQPLEFEAELERSWQDLDDILTYLDEMEDIPNLKVRENLAPKLRRVNQQLEEIRNYLAGREAANQ